MENDFRSSTGANTGGTREKVREKAAEVAGKAKEQIEGRYDEQKGRALSEVNQLASALRRAGNDLSGEGGIGSALLGRVAGHLESLGTTMDGKNLDDIVNDVERLARRNPAMFIGGAMLIGFAASRFLKSSSRNNVYGRGFESGLEYSGSSDFRRDFYDRGSDLDTGYGSSSGVRSDFETSGVGTPSSGNIGTGSAGTTGRSGIGTTGSTGTGSTGFETTGSTRGGRTSGGSGTGSSGNPGGL